MKLNLLHRVLLLGIFAGIYSCENKVAISPPDTGLPAGCDTARTTYSSGLNNVEGIFNTQCAVIGCHTSGTPNPDFTTYEGIYSYSKQGANSNMYLVLFSNNPPGGSRMPHVPQPGWDSCMRYQLRVMPVTAAGAWQPPPVEHPVGLL